MDLLQEKVRLELRIRHLEKTVSALIEAPTAKRELAKIQLDAELERARRNDVNARERLKELESIRDSIERNPDFASDFGYPHFGLPEDIQHDSTS